MNMGEWILFLNIGKDVVGTKLLHVGCCKSHKSPSYVLNAPQSWRHFSFWVTGHGPDVSREVHSNSLLSP